MTKVNLNSVCGSNSYRSVNTIRLSYKTQSVNAAYGDIVINYYWAL